MQVPPEQPIGPGGYPRPSGYGTPDTFPADKPMGIILIVLAAIASCVMLMAVGLGGLVGAAGVAGKSTGAVSSTEATAAGGMLLVFGLIGLVMCALEIVGGVWITKSLKKGFTLVLIAGLIGLVFSIIGGVTGGHFDFVGMGLGLIFPGYSAARLFGNVGPKPIP
jgi:hypothetical protein